MSKVPKGDIELDLVGCLNCAFIQTFLFQQTRIEVENSPIPLSLKRKGRERQRDGICQVATASGPASCYWRAPFEANQFTRGHKPASRVACRAICGAARNELNPFISFFFLWLPCQCFDWNLTARLSPQIFFKCHWQAPKQDKVWQMEIGAALLTSGDKTKMINKCP